MTVLLGIGNGDTYVAGFSCSFVNHRRALHRVIGTVGIVYPRLTIERCLYAILVKEGSIFELCPYLIELHGFAKIYLQPFRVMWFPQSPIGVTSLPQRGVVVINSILWLKPLIVIGRSSDLSTMSHILGVLLFEDSYTLCIVCRHNWQYIAIGIEFHLINTYLAVETMYAAWQVVAMIDDVVFPTLLKNGMMTRTVYRLVGIGLQDTSFVFKRSHRPRCRSGILHPIGVVVTGARRVGEIVDTITFEDKRRLENVL